MFKQQLLGFAVLLAGLSALGCHAPTGVEASAHPRWQEPERDACVPSTTSGFVLLTQELRAEPVDGVPPVSATVELRVFSRMYLASGELVRPVLFRVAYGLDGVMVTANEFMGTLPADSSRALGGGGELLDPAVVQRPGREVTVLGSPTRQVLVDGIVVAPRAGLTWGDVGVESDVWVGWERVVPGPPVADTGMPMTPLVPASESSTRASE